MPEELYVIFPERSRASRIRSPTLFHGLSARTSSTVGSAETSATGVNWFIW